MNMARRGYARSVASGRASSLWSGLIALAVLLLLPGVANAQFGDPAWTDNVQGDIRLAGNTLVSCAPTGEAPTGLCADVLAGDTPGNNAGFVMHQIDVDADPGTDNSSSATLDIPTGAPVLSAYLVWGGSTPLGADPADPTDRARFESVLLDTPAAGGYVPVTADRFDQEGSGWYQSTADVTDVVQAGGTGTYTLANAFVRSGAGNLTAGWALMVAYADATEPWRNLSIYTGFGMVRPQQPGAFNLSGFVTPPAPAPVRAALGGVIYDGDDDIGSDQMRVNGTQLAFDPHEPANNFFRSRITDMGDLVEGRTPNAVNNLGFEWKRFDASSLIDNGDTSALVEFYTSTTSEQFILGGFTAAIELFTPDVQIVKSVENVSRPGQPAWPGDELEYTIEVRNGESPQQVVDTATDVVVSDPIPVGTSYVPGSLEQVDGEPTPAGSRTDGTGDDSAERIADPNVVRFRVGSGANATDGGSLAAGESATVRFRVTVNEDHEGGAIDNVATVDYVAETLDLPFDESDDTSWNVEPTADLAIRKRAATAGKPVPGKLYTYELEVTNNGPATASGTVLDSLPGKKVDYVADNGGCDTAGLPQLSCEVGPLAAGESQTIRVRVRVKPSAKGTLKNSATVTSNTTDTNPSNNEDDTTRKIKPLKPKLALRKQAGVKAARPGDVVPYKITVRNRGKGAAANVRVCDVLPAGLKAVRAPGAAKRSGQRVCWRLGKLAAGAKRTLRITAQVAMSAQPGKLRNTAIANARNTRRASDTSPVTVRSGPSGPCPGVARC